MQITSHQAATCPSSSPETPSAMTGDHDARSSNPVEVGSSWLAAEALSHDCSHGPADLPVAAGRRSSASVSQLQPTALMSGSAAISGSRSARTYPMIRCFPSQPAGPPRQIAARIFAPPISASTVSTDDRRDRAGHSARRRAAAARPRTQARSAAPGAEWPAPPGPARPPAGAPLRRNDLLDGLPDGLSGWGQHGWYPSCHAIADWGRHDGSSAAGMVPRSSRVGPARTGSTHSGQRRVSGVRDTSRAVPVMLLQVKVTAGVRTVPDDVTHQGPSLPHSTDPLARHRSRARRPGAGVSCRFIPPDADRGGLGPVPGPGIILE